MNRQTERVRPAHPPTVFLLVITAVLVVDVLLELVWVLGLGSSSYGAANAVRLLLVVVGALVRVGLLIGVWLGKKSARGVLFGVEVFFGLVMVLAALIMGAASTGSAASLLIGLGIALLMFGCAFLLNSRPVRVWCEGEVRSPEPARAPLAQWAQQQGWQVAWNVPSSVLDQLRGQPFHEYRRKQVPVLMRGHHRGAPAMVAQVDFRHLHKATTGPSYYSPGADRYVEPSKTVEHTTTISAVVVELPAPVPELLVGTKRNLLGDVESLFFLNKAQRLFQGRAVGQVATGGPSIAFSAADGYLGDYYLYDADPAYAHAVLTPERATWLKSNRSSGPVFFRLSGRKLVVWAYTELGGVAVVDALLAAADEIVRWIPPAAYQDPAAAQADQRHVPLVQWQIPVG
ncbi:hypothetical protein OU415_06045 [Saccharopolyspora sp. WRP15-2]|uniref:Uncharacterized protein n=1 Tax=Saccharopolyspora oryzae TaxID=2997343 RepID=A0ABT4UTD7_9PSEU|nr:hypothetical protein [Saccharopolyspora oryzae]MDA3624986.1 hypothetical protein [Saccharopolyspora oryzae]